MVIYADKKYLTSLDEKAKKMKEAILLSESNYPRNAGTIYYVSKSHGDDKNDGTSPEKAIYSLKRLNEIDTQPGSVVLFERGDIWRGQLVTRPSVTYSAYGTGRKPRFYGIAGLYDGSASGVKNWKETDTPDVYEYACPITWDVGNIVFNDGEELAFRRYLCEENTRFDGIGHFEGFSDFTEDLQFWHRKSDNKLFLYCKKGNPGKRFSSIEIGAYTTVVMIGSPGIVLDNLCVRYGGSHLFSWANASNVTIRNCEIGWGGGCFLGTGTRYGNGVEMYHNTDGLYVSNCYIYQIYDAGLTFQSWHEEMDTLMQNISFTDNLIEYCYWSIEYLCIGAYSEKNRINNALFARNFMRFTGYGFGEVRFNSDHCCHINGRALSNPADNFRIEDNILDCSRCHLFNIGADKKEYLPKISGNTYIQYEGKRLGWFGVNEGARHEPPLYFATKADAERMLSETGEQDATVVLVPKKYEDKKGYNIRPMDKI